MTYESRRFDSVDWCDMGFRFWLMTLIGTGQISSRFSPCEFRFIPGSLCFNALVPPENAEQRKLAAIMFIDTIGMSR